MVLQLIQLEEIVGPGNYTTDKLQLITDSLNLTLSKYQINTPLRISHFLAQVLHESSAFRRTEELWEPTAEQEKYDTRVDLGNTIQTDGDGYKYRGRGWIPLTGKAGYQMASREFHQDFINDPDLMQQYPSAAMVSGWFWQRRNLNPFADNDDIVSITKKLCGAVSGLEERTIWLSRAKAAIL